MEKKAIYFNSILAYSYVLCAVKQQVTCKGNLNQWKSISAVMTGTNTCTHARTHTLPNSAQIHIFRLWEEVEMPGENPSGHKGTYRFHTEEPKAQNYTHSLGALRQPRYDH